MRIDRIDIEGPSPLSGTFQFPAAGLGLWAASNQGGKSSLTSTVVAAFYGETERAAAPRRSYAPARITLRVTLDSGRALIITRDLRSFSLRVTDLEGRDITAQFPEGEGRPPLGEQLLGLTRKQFEAVTIVEFNELQGTTGNPVLLSLLKFGRGRPSTPEQAQDDTAADFLPAPVLEKENLQILHCAAEEFALTHPDLDANDLPSEAAGAFGEESPDPDAPGLAPPERLHRLKQQLERLQFELDAKRTELNSHSHRIGETQAEAERLSMLNGAVPEDIERLGQFLTVMNRVRERQETLRIEESKYRRGLEERGVTHQNLQDLEHLFSGLSEEDLAFLESYRQTETIRRGNQALTRSEVRLNETKLDEISRSRVAMSKIASVPLAASTFALLGTLILQLLPVPSLNDNVLFAVGTVGAVVGGIFLWQAKRLRETERRELLRALEQSRSQMEELEKEGKYLAARLGVLSEERSLRSPDVLVQRFEEWKNSIPEIRDLDRFARKHEDVELELAKIGEKLATFKVEGDPDPGTNPQDLDSMYRDYVRFFEVSRDLEEADQVRERIEEELAGVESERVRVSARIQEALSAAGIDPTRELDEAVALFEHRCAEGRVFEFPASPTPASPSDSPPPASEGEMPPGLFDESVGDTQWTAALSTRTQAIALRFLPEISDLAVDANLSPSAKLRSVGARLGAAELSEHLSAGSADQLCLALRLAIVETLCAGGERFPIFLDDPLIRTDDTRHDQALDFLVTDASARSQVVLLTAQEVRSRWFLHQFPQHRSRVASIRESVPAAAPSA